MLFVSSVRVCVRVCVCACGYLRPQCTRKEKKQGFNSGDSPIRVGLRNNYHLKLDQVVHHKTRRFLRRKKSAIFQREPGHLSAFFGAFGAFPR